MTVIGTMLIGLGTLLCLVAAVGVARFPSALSRLHAATKSASLGLALIVIGAAIASRSWPLAGVAALVTAFQFVTAPIAGHLVGRAAVLAGVGGTNAPPSAMADQEPHHPEELSRRVSPIAWIGLTLTWALLWQDFSAGTVIAGGVVAFVVMRVLPTPRSQIRPSIVGSLALFMRYVTLVVLSNLRVAWEVITPDNSDIREAIVDVVLSTRSAAVSTLVANAISYTPGTLTVELRTSTPEGGYLLSIHSLHFTSQQEVEDDVRRLESWVNRALRPVND